MLYKEKIFLKKVLKCFSMKLPGARLAKGPYLVHKLHFLCNQELQNLGTQHGRNIRKLKY